MGCERWGVRGGGGENRDKILYLVPSFIPFLPLSGTSSRTVCQML